MSEIVNSELYSETNSTGATQSFFNQSQDKFRTKESAFFFLISGPWLPTSK